MRIRHIALVFLLAVGAASTASATDFSHDGVVDVFAALAVGETTELHFGIVRDADGTVTIDTGGAITDLSGIHQGGASAAGVYTITGEALQTVAVSFTGASVAPGLTINNFTTDQADLNNVALGGGGSVAVTIGADLTVVAATAATGANQLLAFTVAVTYN